MFCYADLGLKKEHRCEQQNRAQNTTWIEQRKLVTACKQEYRIEHTNSESSEECIAVCVGVHIPQIQPRYTWADALGSFRRVGARQETIAKQQQFSHENCRAGVSLR